MSDRAELRADPTDMDKAITAHTAATAALPEGSVERVTAQLNLLTARATAYDRFGGDANLDAGLTTGESILSAWPEDSLYGRMAQRKLAAVLRLRFFAHGDAEDIKRGLQLAEQAAAGSAPGSEDWLESLITVGEIRRLRYATSGSLEDLEEAIRVLEVAASTTALGPQAQARAQQAMAEMLITRFKVTGGRRDLESAIAASRWALNAFPAGLPISADASASLAEALDHLFAGDPRPEYIAESVELYEQAIQAVRRGSVKWMRWSTGLAVAISLRYQLEENVDHLERAIDYLSDVLQASSAETPGPEWAVTQLELAEVLLERHRVLMRGNGAMANGHDLDAPVAAARAALTAPVLEPSVYAWAHKILGDVYTSRFDEQHDRGDLTAAREAYGQMRSDLRELPSFHYLLIAASGIAQAQALAGDWQAAADEYGEALEIFEAIYAAQVESEGGDAWLRQLGDTYARAAYASVRAGRTDEAVLRLERGRARRLGAALEREQRDLQRVRREHPALYQEYADAAATLRMLGAEVDDVRRSETGADNPIALWRERETAQRNIEHAIDGIRGIEGLEGFLASPTWRSITGAIVSEAPLVYLAATFFGGVALIVTGDRSDSTPVQAVQLDELTGAAVGDLMTAGSSGMSADPWLTAYMDWQENNDEASDARWLTTVDQVTRRLWDLALGPVTETLSASGFDEAVLVPIGLLGLLPLHAAWRPEPSAVTGRRAVVDYLAVSYAPSARAMREAQQREREISQLQLLAVAEPSPSSGGELPHARQEVNAIASLFEQPKVLSGAEASRTAFLEALPAANVAHFACHARANQVVPLESAILMAGDEPLTVRDMMSRRPMTARLAVLSACETAAIGIQLLDEVVGLPAALLQAGFVGVVASLWPVEDAATALLMQRFYTGWKVEGDSPRRALRKAQVGLRDVRGGEFAHPFWWSAFTVVGV